MSIVRRIYVSMPADPSLTDGENALKWAIVDRIEKAGYVPEMFGAGRKAWSRFEADSLAKRCVGAAFLGFPRWRLQDGQEEVLLSTEFSHYEGGIAYTLGLPMLVLAHNRLKRRVIFDPASDNYIARFPDGAGPQWLHTSEFQRTFAGWEGVLRERRDIFLGYCSTSAGTAGNVCRFLEAELGVTVLDWSRDFRPGRTILQEIEDARRHSIAGIFLFTRDDEMRSVAGDRTAAPRDNVVFEAGYFASAKGPERVLIILEDGAKLPADLGGTIYAPLKDRSDIRPLEEPVKRFLNSL